MAGMSQYTLWLVEMFYCESSLPVGIFSEQEIAERWASENAELVARAMYGHPGALDWKVSAYIVNAPDPSWTRITPAASPSESKCNTGNSST